MTVIDGQAPRDPRHAESIRPWSAIGNASQDLPEWVIGRSGWRIASTSIAADAVHGVELEQAACSAFAAALRELGAAPARVWAHLPRITAGDRDGLDRYMRMNRGRGQAYREAGLPIIPAGTCTGHAGHDLVVHAIAIGGPVVPVENPRQRPAWDYSARFGPQPPPFTRGVVGSGVLVASGTASVVGEESLHAGDAPAQWEETMRNLEALSAASGAVGPWRAVRVYVSDATHFEEVSRMATSVFGDSIDSIVLAPLCRRELLVEVEGIRDVRNTIV